MFESHLNDVLTWNPPAQAALDWAIVGIVLLAACILGTVLGKRLGPFLSSTSEVGDGDDEVQDEEGFKYPEAYEATHITLMCKPLKVHGWDSETNRIFLLEDDCFDFSPKTFQRDLLVNIAHTSVYATQEDIDTRYKELNGEDIDVNECAFRNTYIVTVPTNHGRAAYELVDLAEFKRVTYFQATSVVVPHTWEYDEE